MDKLSDWRRAAAAAVARVTDRWAIAGALAADAYRVRPRFTTDVDILVEWHQNLIPSLEEAGYDLRVLAMPDDHPHLLMSRGEMGKVDFIIPTVEYQELALDRAVDDHVLTVEDVIIHKLIADRPRDIGDVESILEAGHVLDLEYLERWLVFWDVLDRWENLRG